MQSGTSTGLIGNAFNKMTATINVNTYKLAIASVANAMEFAPSGYFSDDYLQMSGGGNAFIHTTSGSGGRITGIGTFANARKVAIAYKNKNSCLSINGVNYTNSTFNMPIGIDRLAIGNQAGSVTRPLNGWIKVVKYWPKRLTNDQLLMLTR